MDRGRLGLGYTWAEGLRAGTYALAAEDDSGLYFLGEGKSVVYMSNEAADQYVKTGEIKGYGSEKDFVSKIQIITK